MIIKLGKRTFIQLSQIVSITAVLSSEARVNLSNRESILITETQLRSLEENLIRNSDWGNRIVDLTVL